MDVVVRHNAGASRYEVLVDGRLVGLADYDETPSAVVFVHTEIDPAVRRRGLAAALVTGALDDVRRSGRTVVPRCWYVARFIDEHPEYRDLLPA
jgi:predicted GNAT family acetyltransferase